VAAWVTAVGGISVALVAGLFAYFNSRRSSERQARLDRVNRQLEELYGPALAHAHASATAWLVFRSNYRPGGYFFEPDAALSDEERNAWVAWMKFVFMPSNRAIYQLIISKTHLLDDDDMPPPLLAFLAHVAGYEVTLAAWAEGDYSQLTSLINHPGGSFQEYLANSFSKLKRRQQLLLGMTGSLESYGHRRPLSHYLARLPGRQTPN
jgi:hypothetical protein